MRFTHSTVVLALSLLSIATPAAADMFGVRAGVYTNTEKPFLGAELLVPLSHSVYLNPNVEYVFVDDGSLMTFNADFHYDFPTRSATLVWAGAGLAVLHSNPERPRGNSTDVGANFLFGLGRRGDVVPYIQAKLIVADDTEFVIGVGLRF